MLDVTCIRRYRRMLRKDRGHRGPHVVAVATAERSDDRGNPAEDRCPRHRRRPHHRNRPPAILESGPSPRMPASLLHLTPIPLGARLVPEVGLVRALPAGYCMRMGIRIPQQLLAVTLSAALGGGLVSGCALAEGAVTDIAAQASGCLDGSGQRAMILVSATHTDVAPALTNSGLDTLRASATSNNVTDGPGGRGSSVEIVTADGHYSPVLPLTPRRPDCSVEHGPARTTEIEENLTRVTTTLAASAATESGLDLLRGVDYAVRGQTPGLLIIIGHGLSSSGALDIGQVGFAADPAMLVAQLRAAGQLPSLAGWTVQWEGLGTVTGVQAVAAGGPVLPKSIRTTVQSYYQAILIAGGATSVMFDDAPLADHPPAGSAAMPVFTIPRVRSVTGATGKTVTTIPTELLGFAANSAVLPASAAEVLDPVVADIKMSLPGRPDAAVTITAFVADAPGPVDGMALSRARAEACKAYLVAAGIANPILVIGGGVPQGESAYQDGHFSEARAAGMRRARIEY